MRVARSLVAFLFVLAGTAMVGLTLVLYLAATGRNLPMLRSVAALIGRTLSGQETTAVSLAIRLDPEQRRLSGTARLTVRAAGAERARLYFLLNDGLSTTAAWEEAADGTRTALGVYRAWLLTIVELRRPLAANEEIRIGIDYAGEPRASTAGASGLVMTPDDVIITPADFWYPADLQGFFLADVDVLLPSQLTLVHNGREASRTGAGTSTAVRFSTERPVAGLALVAGRYVEHASDRGGVRSRVFLAEDVRVDPTRLLDALTDSQQTLTAWYGASGFERTSMFVNHRLGRGFNDGTALVGMPPRYFTDGEHGFELIAHEVAHNWWGGTVAEHWLLPGTGGEWIVEGFAEFSGWRALRQHRGEPALLRLLARSFFDPDRTTSLASVSVLDNAFDPQARSTIYEKGGWVTAMLHQRLGDDAFDAACRRFLDQFRFRVATAGELESVFSEATQQDLAPFFATWVRGDESIDLALDPEEGGAAVRNHRTAPPPAELALWRFPPGSEPEKQSTALGATTPIGNAERVVLDPLAAVADMFRSNNVLPRHANPRVVATSARDDLMTVLGEPYAWEPATIEVAAHGGVPARSWEIDRGLMAVPTWSADGTRILAVESPRGGQPTLLALNVTDGSRHTIGHDTIATASADATIVARDSRLLRIAGGRTAVLADHPGARIWAPIASPTGAVAYAVSWPSERIELWLLPAEGGEGRVLFTWPAAPLRWRWSPDGSRLYAALAADWDWQLWEIPIDGGESRVMVREAATITDLAVSADGERIALVAQADIDDPLDHAEVFVAERLNANVRRYNLSGRTAYGVAWRDPESLVVIVADPDYPSLPVYKELRTLRLSDGSLEPYPD